MIRRREGKGFMYVISAEETRNEQWSVKRWEWAAVVFMTVLYLILGKLLRS